MDITNLLNCLILTRSTLPLSSSIFLPPNPSPLFFPISLLLHQSLPFSLSSFFLLPLLPPYLSSPPSFSLPLLFPSSLFLPPSISPLVFSPCYIHYLSIPRSMTLLINLSPSQFPLCISSPPSLPPPLFSSPPFLCFFVAHFITTYLTVTTIAFCYCNFPCASSNVHTEGVR